MTQQRTTRGFALTGLMCIGGLACEQGGGGADAQATDESTGYELTDTSGSDSSSSSATGFETQTETGESTMPETDEPPDCSYRGDICGEMSVCQCSCDYSADCCSCEPTACTQDIHCPGEEICLVYVEDHSTKSQCLPAACAAAPSVSLSGPDADSSEFAGVVCARSIRIEDTSLVDLSDFNTIEHVVGAMQIVGNPMLSTLDGLSISEASTIEITYNDNLASVAALTSLESIEGGTIYCNGQLPALDVDAALAQISGGDLVEVANNGEGPC